MAKDETQKRLLLLQQKLGDRTRFYIKKLNFSVHLHRELTELGLANCSSNIEKGSELEIHMPRVQLDQNEILSSNFSDLYDFHVARGKMNFTADFLDAVHDIVAHEDKICSLYSIYKQNNAAQCSIFEAMKNKDKKQFFKRLQSKYNLPFPIDSTYFLSPMKILNVYKVSLEAVAEYVNDKSVWKDNILHAVEILENIMCVMEIVPSIPWLWDLDLDSVIGDRINLVEHSKIELLGKFSVFRRRERGRWDKIKSFIKPHKRYVLLYENCIIIGKQFTKSGIRSQVPLIRCKEFFLRKSINLTENISETPLGLALTDEKTGKTVIIKLDKVSTKHEWVAAIQRCPVDQRRLPCPTQSADGSPV